MPSCWEQLVVVAPSVMPTDLAKALLESGAKAVICRSAEQPADSPNAAAEYFTAFYQHLLSGRPVVASLAHAGMIFGVTAYLCDSLGFSIELA